MSFSGQPSASTAPGFPGCSPVLLPLLVLGVLLHPVSASAQTAQQILTQAMERFEERLAGVDDLTLRQEVMGFPTTAYLVKETVDGRPLLRARSVDAGPMEMDPTEDAAQLWADPGRFYADWANRWVLEGTGSVDGRPTWTLALTNFQGLDWDAAAPGRQIPFEPERLVLEMDQDRLVPLRVGMAGHAVHEGEERPVAVDIRMEDYREVEGYLHPHLIVMETDLASAGMSPEDVARAREGLDELRRQLEQAPEAQREMMERMLGGQMEQLEEMVAGETLRVEMRVTELLVNRGPPGSGS